VVAVGLKTYLGWTQTTQWLDAVAASCARFGSQLDIVVLPTAPLLPHAVATGRRSGFQVGAQQISEHPPGAFTGELPAALLQELGVSYAEIGHAERRSLFGETPAMVRAKVAACQAAGLTPLLCVGEGVLGHTAVIPPAEAAAQTCRQLADVLVGGPATPLLVAYEPVWAIGAEQPAPVEHVRVVAAAIRQELRPYPAARLIYGGTAGPGLFAGIEDAVDGLFLGRRSHDPAAFATTLSEVAKA
jgi:triosephosphate isomerase